MRVRDLMSKSVVTIAPEESAALAARLLDTGAMFYTCHCTGPVALAQLKTRMGGRLEALSTGMVLEI